MYQSEYGWALPIIAGLNINIKKVAEIGSRDALDAIFLAEFYSATVDVFEPDPINIATIRKNISKSLQIQNLTLHDYALSNKNEIVKFLSVDRTKYDNPGVGSFYEIDFSNRSKKDPDFKRESIQKPISVEAKCFDSLSIQTPDLIAMDVQGAELVVLEGFREKLKDVKVIILETSFSENYIGGSTFQEVHDFLQKNNFLYVASDRFKNKLPRPNLIKKLLNRYEPDFNCLYVNNK
jgi:FkbM family methyltransferase